MPRKIWALLGAVLASWACGSEDPGGRVDARADAAADAAGAPDTTSDASAPADTIPPDATTALDSELADIAAGPDVAAPADVAGPRRDAGPLDVPPRFDLAPPPDFGGLDVRPPPPPPPINPAARKLLPARSELLGLHRSGCSHGEPFVGARWCAVSRPGAQLGRLELWVLNVTAATAPGADVKCDGTSADCIRLTTNLFSSIPDDGPSYPTDHRFYGDTLIYYADNSSAPADLYRGPIYAWRPGWTAGKPIASGNGVLCTAHTKALVAICIENISRPTAPVVTWDLHAGPIEGGPLKKVATISPVHPTTQATQWGTLFTKAGDYLMFSTPLSATGQEALHVIKTSDIGTAQPTLVASGASRWALNADESRWFYLREYNYNVQGEQSGALYMRDFPGGATETRIQGSQIPGGTIRGVGSYQVLADAAGLDAGIAFVAPVIGGRGNYRIMKNPAGSADDLANFTTVANDISLRRMPIFSRDLRLVYFSKTFDEMVGTTDSWIIGGDGIGACALTTSLNSWLLGVPFLDNAGLVFWMDNFDAATDSGEGWLANPTGCTGKRLFSRNIDFWFVKGSELLLYSDDSNGRAVTLRAARIDNGQWPAGPTEIQRGITRLYTVVGDFEAVLYNIDSTSEAVNGAYYIKLP